jgi:deoxyribose-phosphate aldolase
VTIRGEEWYSNFIGKATLPKGEKDMHLLSKEKDMNQIAEICRSLDYSMPLVENAKEETVIEACHQAIRYKFATVPVFPCYAKLAAEQLQGSSTTVDLALGFPSGAHTVSAKAKEAEVGLKDGVKEIDMVLNIGRLVDGDFAYVENEIRTIADIAKGSALLKVIIETGFLNDQQKRSAVEIICSAGADYVKTCTGFAKGKATIHDILLLSEQANSRIKVKASGGVSGLEDAEAFMNAGASRIAGRVSFVEQLESLGIKEIQ